MKYTIELAQPSGPRVSYNIRHGNAQVSKLFERNYTWAEAMEVLDWVNGRDQPLAAMVAPELDTFLQETDRYMNR